MRNGFVKFIWILLIGLFFGCNKKQSINNQPVNPGQKITSFQLKAAVLVNQNGAEISTGDFQPDHWYPVAVPSTVLRALVNNGVYPDPYIGMNNMKIPDASDKFNKKYGLTKYSYLPNKENPWKTPYWYRSTFKLSKAYQGKHLWLTFKGINYKADVWLNGKQIADSSHMKSMFKKFTYNITQNAQVGQTNYLAVKIYPVDHPGEPAQPQTTVLGPFGSNGGLDDAIGKDVTMLCSIGWDWIPAIRDREMGIWEGVNVQATGLIKMEKPHVVTKLSLPDTTKARLTIQTHLINLGDQSQNGVVHVSIAPHNFKGNTVQFSQKITLSPNQYKEITFSPDNTQKLLFQNPHLWWPNNYGQQNLYDLTMNVQTKNGYTDQQKVTFGIRQIDSKVVMVGKYPRRDFYINGEKIHLTGGAWVPDLLLHKTAKRYEQEMKLWKQDNLNLVRVWGGGIAPPDDFFKACDEDGLLVWQDFWISGDTNGRFGGSRDWPLSTELFLSDVKSTIKRLRNHPSLLLWTGGNETYPRKDILQGISKYMAQLDGTRPFLPSSANSDLPPKSWGWTWPDNGPSGTYSGGPYYWVPPAKYYQLADSAKDWVFKNEVGIPSVPSVGVLKRFIPDLKPDPSKPYPLNNTWGYHDACEGNGKYSYYDNAIRNEYGKPTSLSDYVDKAQLVNAVNYRAIFEAVNKNLKQTSGVLLWKVNSSWPSVMWQLYDWYLRPNAGYYYTKKANEPIHIQLNLDNHNVAVINKRYIKTGNLIASAKVFDINMNLINQKSQEISVGPDNVKELFKIEPKRKSGIYFVDLNLTDQKGNDISHNFYWMSPDHNYKKLMNLKKANLDITKRIVKENGQEKVYIDVKNRTNQLAFFINIEIVNASNNQEILPSYWSDNYFSLLPERQKTVTVTYKPDPGSKKYLLIKGVNIKPMKIEL